MRPLSTVSASLRSPSVLFPALVIAATLFLHLATNRPSEPFYNNDEPRHVMTGVFFRDLIADGGWTSPLRYASAYYVQYPALALAIYPPLFHLIEGAVMTVFGTSVAVGKSLVLLFASLGSLYLYRLARRTHGERVAALAALLFLMTPAVFNLSRYVMLEMPTLACALVFLFHWDRYLGSARRRDLAIAAGAAAATALMRFSALFLAPAALLLVLFEPGRWRRVSPRDVVVAALLACALVAPYYALAAQWSGGLHLRQVTVGIGDHGNRSFLDYPASLPRQIGWPLMIAALVGITQWVRRRDHLGDPYAAVILATYVTFTPLAIHDPRFVVYWVPAFAVFGSAAVAAVRGSARIGIAAGIALVLIVGTATSALRMPHPFLRGYAEAARFVAANTRTSRYTFFDGTLNGDFIYQLRRADPARRIRVLRGDRMLYSVEVMPTLGYTEFFTSGDSMLADIHRYDPDWVMIEEPPLFFRTLAGDRLRAALRAASGRYRLERRFAIESDLPEARGAELLAYRSLDRNRAPESRIEIRLPALHRSIKE